MAPEVAFGTLSLITLLLFVGATGKSAQIPLYTWLPDAMEGPTPVSALIHAATMVTAGVYMIGRNAVLFEHAPITLGIVAAVGAATALFAGTIGLVQNDIKRVLAYSTVSQLGYMFLAMGVGAFGAGVFHLYTHAFFKACLFLGSGAVIHALHGEQDIRHMGGLKKDLPITYWTFLIASLAIAGVPLLAGFFSKDEILFETFRHGHTWLWVVGAITSLLTATYMFRLVFLTFHGERRAAPAAARHDAHGTPRTATAHARPRLRLTRAWHGGGHGHGGTARRAAGDGARAHRPGHRLGAGRLPRRAARARRPQRAGRMAAPVVRRHLEGAGRVQRPGVAAGRARRHDAGGMRAGRRRAGGGLVGADRDRDGRCRPRRSDAGPRPAASTAPPAKPRRDRARADADGACRRSSRSSASAWPRSCGSRTRRFRRRWPRSFPGLHRLLLNKYYVDEIYDAAIVHPIQRASTEGLWKVA